MEETAPGEGITVGQFVSEVHEYISECWQSLVNVGFWDEDSVLTWGEDLAKVPRNTIEESVPQLKWELWFADTRGKFNAEAFWQANAEYLRGNREEPPFCP